MVQLCSDRDSVFVDRLGQPLQAGDEFIVAQAHHEVSATVLVNRTAAYDDEPNAPGSPFDVELYQSISDEASGV
jgi:hypothetical protein